MRLDELAAKIGATVIGNPAADILSCATLEEAQPAQVSFLANPRYQKQVETTRASAVIVAPNITTARADLALLQAKDPYYAFMLAVVELHGHRRHPHHGIHPAAHVDPSATVGHGTILYPGAYVGPRARVGRDCILYPNAVVYDDCILGDRVTLHAGAVIGTDGFGYATHKGIHHKIPQTGNVILEDDVEIGANCAVQRATLGSTTIGKGTKFGDLIDIGHGTRIGPHGLFVSLVGVAGSTTIGRHAVVGGQVGIVGHIEIGDQVTMAGRSMVTSPIPDKQTVLGVPAMEIGHTRRVWALTAKLPDLAKRLKDLEKRLEELENKSKPENAPGQ